MGSINAMESGKEWALGGGVFEGVKKGKLQSKCWPCVLIFERLELGFGGYWQFLVMNYCL